MDASKLRLAAKRHKLRKKIKEDVEPIDEKWFGKSEPAKEQPVDAAKGLHDVLTKHGYKYEEKEKSSLGYHRVDRKYQHAKTYHYARLNPQHLSKDAKTQKTTVGGPQVTHSTGKRFTNHKELDSYLHHLHGAKNEEKEPNRMNLRQFMEAQTVGVKSKFDSKDKEGALPDAPKTAKRQKNGKNAIDVETNKPVKEQAEPVNRSSNTYREKMAKPVDVMSPDEVKKKTFPMPTKPHRESPGDGPKTQKEEAEQIDEISRGKLANYIPRAHAQGSMARSNADRAYKANVYPRTNKTYVDKMDKIDDKRNAGIHLAAAKLGGSAKVNAKEEVEQIDELSTKTLKNYAKRAETSGYRLDKKGEKEEDKSMSTDGYKYPEKQARHQRNASALYHKAHNRSIGVLRAHAKIVDKKNVKEEVDQIDELHGKGKLESILKGHKATYKQYKKTAGDRDVDTHNRHTGNIARASGLIQDRNEKLIKKHYGADADTATNSRRFNKFRDSVKRPKMYGKRHPFDDFRKEEVELEMEDLTEQLILMEKYIDQMSRKEQASFHAMMGRHHSDLAARATEYAETASENPKHWHDMAALHHQKASGHAKVLAGLKSRKAMYAEEAEQIDERRYSDDDDDDRQERSKGKSSIRELIRKNRDAKAKRRELEVAEEVEQIDEISKKTLGSYINKATASATNAGHALGKKESEEAEITRFSNRHGKLGDLKYRDTMHQMAGVDTKSKMKDYTTLGKRHKGIAAATKRLTKEEAEVVTEISQKLARNYASRSAQDQVRLNDKSIYLGNQPRARQKHGKELDKIDRKFNNRYVGLNRAHKRTGGVKYEPKF